MKSPESGPHYPVFGMGQKNYRFWRDGSEGGGIDEEEVTIPALVIGTERKRKSFHSYDSSVSRFYVTYMMSGGNRKCEMEWNGDACSDGSFSLSSHLQ